LRETGGNIKQHEKYNMICKISQSMHVKMVKYDMKKITKLWSASQKGNEKMASMIKYEVTVH
jgi:hypothetical protein